MIRFLADENFNSDILRGLRRRAAEIDVVRVQDANLRGEDDETILAWAARGKAALDDLVLIANCSIEHEWDNHVLFLALR